MTKSVLTREDIENEIAELEADQHADFFKNEPKGRKRMATLLRELNVIEKADTI